MKPISEQKWWRVARSCYNAPRTKTYSIFGETYFYEYTFSGEHIYTRVTVGDKQYCVRSHKDEWMNGK